jgi:CheY-like chemotaxis protein
VADILVIDDCESTRVPLRTLLEASGHRVLEAPEGAAAMRLLRGQAVDVVFCDLFMPGQEGLETIRLLRRELPHVRVVAMSGGGARGQMNLLDVAVKLGACAALVKPFESEELFAVVEAALGPDES